jgi:hypothetical protein
VTLVWQAHRGLVEPAKLGEFVITTVLPVLLVWVLWAVVQLGFAASRLNHAQEVSLRTKQDLIDLNVSERNLAETRMRDSHRRRSARQQYDHQHETDGLRSEIAQLRASTAGDVLATIDDRIRVVSLMAFEPEWKNFSETYWLIGSIKVENRKQISVAIDGYLEASHSNGPLRFQVEGTAFLHWTEAMRTTHQASSPQLILPVRLGPGDTIRGIALIRFPASELGGFGKYSEPGQQCSFVLTLNGDEGQWKVPLKLPYQWNPQPKSDPAWPVLRSTSRRSSLKS